MNKDELIRKIELMIQDKNYMINSSKDEKKVYACKYSRIDLENVLKLVKNLND